MTASGVIRNSLELLESQFHLITIIPGVQKIEKEKKKKKKKKKRKWAPCDPMGPSEDRGDFEIPNRTFQTFFNF